MKPRIRSLLQLLFLFLFMFPAFAQPAQAQSAIPTAVVVELEGPLTPVWSGMLERAIHKADVENADVLVIELNTPGGGVELMNSLMQQILASPVPVVVYVSPRGAMAASAGTLIVLSGQIGAMAPESSIGAASPVGMQGEDIESTLEEKTKEILKASARSLAERRGEAAIQLVEEAIDSAKAASASEALKAGLIDIVAKDMDDLFVQLDGRTVLVNGEEVVLQTRGAQTIPVEPSMIEEILGMLTNPNIVFILLSIGVQAILIEISSPGGWVAGTIGVILMALAIYGLGILPVNWFGIVFLIVAFVLFILDIKAPTHGALTAVGTASFIAGALILFNSVRLPGYQPVSVGLVIGMGIFIGLTFFAVVMVALRAMKKPIITGRESLTGRDGYVVTRLAPSGVVQVAGEQWSASLEAGERPLKAGDKIRVVRVEGVRLIVKPLEGNETQHS
ncbi:MAG: nodulation protein NfeD [Anaerolineaceae bacterium]|nr:nodulation protein NfeD [Anaerolineaceae bacterium]